MFTTYNYRQEISTFPRHKPAAFLKKYPGIKESKHENHITAWLRPSNRKKKIITCILQEEDRFKEQKAQKQKSSQSNRYPNESTVENDICYYPPPLKPPHLYIY